MELQSSRLTYPKSSKGKICQTRTTHSAKLSLKNEDKIKTTPDKQNPSCKTLQEVFQMIIQIGMIKQNAGKGNCVIIKDSTYAYFLSFS